MFNKEEPITFPSERQIQAEDLCFTAAKHCGIGRVARHLFALQNKRTCCYLSPCEWVGGDDQDVQLEFRLRFQVPDIERLQEVDEEALDYYFHQIRSDFLSERIPSVLDAKEKVLGLAVADMVRVIKEKGSSRDVTVKDYKKYLPRKLIQKMQWSFPWIKSDMRNNMEELNKSIEDASYIKSRYINQIIELSQNYFCETFTVQVDELGQVQNIKLQVDPYHKEHPGLRMQGTGKCKDYIGICTIEELCFVCMRQDNTVEVSRKNGVPKYFRFQNRDEMHSFVSVLAGYYRLMERWTFDLCKDIASPFLLTLRALKCHGPVGREFAHRKLQEKRQNRAGCFILRESWKYDTYCLDICVENQTTPQTLIIETNGETFNFKDSSELFPSLPLLLSNFSEDKQGILRDCVPPSEYDISPLLLCRPKSKGQALTSNVQPSVLQPLCIKNGSLTWSDSIQLNGRMTFVCKGLWQKDSMTQVPVAVKQLKSDAHLSTLHEFLRMVNDCAFWHSETIVVTYGVMLANPLALITEYFPLGALDFYLQLNRSKLQEIDLVEAATYLANALWYLEERQIVHGNIRCRNLFVVEHTDTTFSIKLSDPGIAVYSDEQIHWIPPECYKDRNLIHKSHSADVWALGTTLWEIFSYGEKPSLGTSIEEAKILYRRGIRLPNSHHNQCNSDIYKVMNECWTKDPDARKKPQAVLRDINQILYEVHNSRRRHTYAMLNGSSISPSSSIDCFSNVPTLLMTNRDNGNVTMAASRSSESSRDAGSDQRHNSVSTPIADSTNIPLSNVDSNSNPAAVLRQLTTLTTSPSNISIESMVPFQSEPGWIIDISQLQMHDKLGQGFYGEVRRATLTHFSGLVNVTVAVKQIKSADNKTGYQDLQREIKIMKTLQHKNIVEIKGVVEDPETLLVMEYVPLGSLLIYIKTQRNRLTEKQLLKFSLDIAEGMEYLGQQSIVHRDLAARNILVATEDLVKISDFGLAQMTGNNNYYKLKTDRNLPIRWYSPETLETWRFDNKSDVWSYGVTLWEMFSYGQEPVLDECAADDVDALCRLYASGRRLRCPATCSVRIYTDLMNKCWEANPISRPNFSQLRIEIEDLYDKAEK